MAAEVAPSSRVGMEEEEDILGVYPTFNHDRALVSVTAIYMHVEWSDYHVSDCTGLCEWTASGYLRGIQG